VNVQLMEKHPKKEYDGGMKTETITQKLLRRLDESAGKHCKIAREVGIGQATISRIYQRKVSPSLRNVEALIAWFDADEAKSAQSAVRLANTKRVRVRRTRSAATAALTQ